MTVTRTGTVVPSPLRHAGLRDRVDGALTTFLDRQQRRLRVVGDEVTPLVATLRGLLGGGKRLRPAFAYWAWRGAGAPDDDRMVAAAAALELFQACALVHDDVMDRSELRRGMPAAHRQFATLHLAEGWRGDPGTFGTNAAILLGDLCLSWSDELLFGSGLPADALARGRLVYDEMRTELMAGQYLDLLGPAAGAVSAEQARRVLLYKSAKYTVERPLLLGCALAGGDSGTALAYSRYGLPVGEAFQLRDDVLGVFGDPAETGKPAGDDLREGKRTVLVALAFEQATPAQAALLDALLGDPTLDSSGVDALRQLIVDTGALEQVERLIDDRLRTAEEVLRTHPFDPEVSAVLGELAVAAAVRRL